MDFLTKIEDFINGLITRFGELVVKVIMGLIPQKVLNFYQKVRTLGQYAITNFKSLPAIIKVKLIALIARLKAELLAYDYRGKILETKAVIQEHYKKQGLKGAGKLKTMLMTPVILVSDWLRGLTAVQSMMLMGFTCASILASINIVSTGNRLMSRYNQAFRGPASVEEVITYDRPVYYKKDTKHVLISNVRLPVYIGEVNELRSVDIDFNATMSNRQTKMFLEKYEFQLRDYLIIQIEPIIASFPLEEEGREMLKQKIRLEIDNFLKERNFEGHVTELKITYVLAN